MNKISDRIEGIFAHAVAMEQSGRLRSTIYCIGPEIFILNSDSTVLLRFLLRRTETPFAHPVSFRANDYDSRQFYEKDGKIVFSTESDNFTRTKSCATPGDSPEDIKALFATYRKLTDNKVVLSREILSLLDDALSHVEISAPDKVLNFVQRNIYSGAVITVKRKKEEGLGGLAVTDNIETEFGPLGMRTNDFSALFTFADSVNLFFPSEEADYCYIKSNDPNLMMEGIISLCVYDELGGVEVSRKGGNHGREESQVRGRQRGANSTTDKKQTRRCR